MSNQLLNNNSVAPQIPKGVLPDIPDKIYFTIGEVSELCDLKPHVLRYWEEEFPQLKPNKRAGNRRYYLRDDVLMVRKIKNLLYEQGFTIEGAKTKLAQEKRTKLVEGSISNDFMNKLLFELQGLLEILQK